ncbi:MAG: chemotaxis protein CheA [Vicinamibacterales bacterium]
MQPADDLVGFAADPEMAALFVADGLDHLSTIENVVLQLESAPGDAALLNDLFRPFHTVKGNAGVLGLMTIQGLAHKMETLLDLARSGAHPIQRADVDVVLSAVDLLTLMIRELPARAAGEPGSDVEDRRLDLMLAVDALLAGADPEPTAPTEPAPHTHVARDEGHDAVKVDTRKLDNLVDMVGELVIAQSILAADPLIARCTEERLNRRLAQLTRITSDLQRTAMSMRMMPVRQTFQKMARLVRDLSRTLNKPVEVTLSGEDTELDRKLIEQVTDPLMHMVRNSIDHGIETAEVRAAAGKPATAQLRLDAHHQAGTIVIEISDDGAGLNTDKILAKGVEHGLVAPGATLTPNEIHQLIFQPGFSTADRITDLSGRGVGMDIVRRNIETLRGRIDIQTGRGAGTTFTIRLPLTLAIVDGLLLGVGSERFVIPTFAVRESLRPLPQQLHSVHERALLIQVRERLIPVLHLGDTFQVAGARRTMAESTVVVIEDNGHPVALVVDELIGKQEVVIKTLGEAFGHVQGIAGGAILGDGRIGLILDAGGLLALAGREATRAA